MSESIKHQTRDLTAEAGKKNAPGIRKIGGVDTPMVKQTPLNEAKPRTVGGAAPAPAAPAPKKSESGSALPGVMLVAFVLALILMAAAALAQSTNAPGTRSIAGTSNNTNAPGVPPLTFVPSGSVLVGVHDLFVAPYGTNLLGARGDDGHPWGMFYDYVNGKQLGVCAAATNGDTIYVLPGHHFSAQIVLKPNQRLIGIGNPIIERTNWFGGAITNVLLGNTCPLVVTSSNNVIQGINFVTGTLSSGGTHLNDNVFGRIDSGDTLYDYYGTEDPASGIPVITNLTQVGSAYTGWWPQFGFTNTSADPVYVNNCTLNGYSDDCFIRCGRVQSIQIDDGSNANPPIGNPVIKYITNSPSRYFFSHCTFAAPVDTVNSFGSNLTWHTEFCRFLCTSNGVVNSYNHGPRVNPGVTYTDVGSVIYCDGSVVLSNSNNAFRCGGIVQEGGGTVLLNGTRIYATNGVPILFQSSSSTNVPGWWQDGLRLTNSFK